MFAASIAKLPGKSAAPFNDHSAARPAPRLRHDRRIETAQVAESEAHLGLHSPDNATAWDFSSVPLRPPGRSADLARTVTAQGQRPLIQAKLTVGASDDPLEHEADRVAEQVMRSAVSTISVAPAPPQISRKCDACEDENRLQRKEAGPGLANQDAGSGVHGVLEGSGAPIDPVTRAFFEPRFGQDFSQVRVHTGGAAEAAAQSLNARAMTAGNHIVFGAGQYAPTTGAGRTLIAHELTHVVQQGRGQARGTVQRDPVKDGEARKEGAPKADPVEMAVKDIERNWQGLVAVATPFKELQPWIADGNAVVALIQDHVKGAQTAISAKDEPARRAYSEFLASDKIMYDFIAWHVTVYANLLSLRGGIDSLINSFDHDSEVGFGQTFFRKFKGRDNADRIAREIKKAIDGVPDQSKSMLSLVRTDVPVGGASMPKSIGAAMVTSAAIPEAQATFKDRITKMRDVQINLQKGMDFENQFLDGAFEAGLDQAIDNLEEYYKIKNALKKPDFGPKSDKKQEPDLKPVLIPLTAPSEDEKKKKKKRKPTMRHQIQQGKDKHYSSLAAIALDDDIGVTGQQLRETMVANLKQYMDIAEGKTKPPPGWTKGPVAWKAPITMGIIDQSKAIREIVSAGGVDVGGNVRGLQRCFDPGTLKPSGCASDDVRLDVENNGHNLKQD